MQSPGRLEWFLLLSCVLIWGSSFILMKKSLVVFSAEEVAALRLSAAGLCLLPFGLRTVLRQGWRNWPWPKIALSGLTGNFIPAFLFAAALTQVDSGTSGVLNSLTPLWVLALGALLFRRPVGRWQAAGVALGWVGAFLLLMTRPSSGPSETSLTYGALIVVATVLYGFNTNFVKTRLSHLPALPFTSMALGLWSVPALIYLATADLGQRMEQPGSGEALAAALTLGCVGTAFALLLFFTLLRRSDALFAASVTYFMPVVALALALADGERMQWLHPAGLALILGGVWLVNRKPAGK